MLNDIIKGMAEKIRTVYRPEDYRLYTEDVKQGFKEPCFFISAVEHGHVKCLNTRYKEEYYMSVQYFPKGGSAECAEVSGELPFLLEYIEAGGDLIHGVDISSRIPDGALVFLIKYTVFVSAALPEDEFMERVEINGETI